ncbi:MAG: NAD(+) kinase, partial [Endozoicomonas sp.]
LTDVSPDELEDQLSEVLEGRYLAESRFLLEACVRRKGKVIGQGDALNDVVLHPGESTRIIEFELYIDGQFVYQQRADGLIIATPTGSTAYALSGGGPIMHPRLDAIVLVPMYPHMLTNRPLVVDGESELKLVIREENTIYPQVSCDGQIHITSSPGDEITIHKKADRLKLLHPLNHNFYESCRSKLRWNDQEDRC